MADGTRRDDHPDAPLAPDVEMVLDDEVRAIVTVRRRAGAGRDRAGGSPERTHRATAHQGAVRPVRRDTAVQVVVLAARQGVL